MSSPDTPDFPPPPPADLTPEATPNTSRQPVSKIRPPSHASIPIPQAGADEWAGKYLGPYLIRHKLARGGMGEVLLGFDETLRRNVAVKVMDRKLISDGDALKRFEREARACASVQHPNIAGIYLVGITDDGLPFLAMEYIDGGSLMNVIRNKTVLSFSEVAAMMEAVALGLQAAQKQNVVHRDIKPANIMLTQKRQAKLVDFGLAKIFFEDSYVTQEGMVLGTPSYMAPEQGRGRVVDHRADVYSFGATFYHLIVGRPPFTADSPVQIMMKHVTAPLVPMKSLNQAVPFEFDEIVGKCMRKDVDERYQDYEALIVDIKRLRLQCTTRERGSIIGGDGSTTNHNAGRGSSSGSLSLPAAPGGQPGGRSSSSPIVNKAAIIDQYDANSPEARGFWNPVTISAVSVLTLLILGGIVAAVLYKSPDDSTTSATTQRSSGRPAFAALLDKAAEKSRSAKDDAAVDAAYQSFKSSVEILKSLQEGVVNYEIDKQALPSSLKQIANENSVRMNFEIDEEGNPLDAWSEPIAFDPGLREIRSAGLDGSLYDSDDLVINLDGKTKIPTDYQKLKGK